MFSVDILMRSCLWGSQGLFSLHFGSQTPVLLFERLPSHTNSHQWPELVRCFTPKKHCLWGSWSAFLTSVNQAGIHKTCSIHVVLPCVLLSEWSRFLSHLIALQAVGLPEMQLLTQTLTKEKNVLVNTDQVQIINNAKTKYQVLKSHSFHVFSCLTWVQHLVLHVHTNQDKKSRTHTGLGQWEDTRWTLDFPARTALPGTRCFRKSLCLKRQWPTC